MNLGDQHRIAKRHLDRRAVVYVRQSDPQQVREHTESTQLQRGLRERAIEMGWVNPKLVEDDLGISAGGFAERPGFQWMLTQVTMRKVGIIFCIEASRLSRNSADWAHLFELCGYFDTLVADPQQVYDVSIPNDRLVLQIKGTVAELELSSMKIRLRAGIEAKAARGELKVLLPPGYVYDADDQIVFDPDERVQQAIRSMFEQFELQTSIRQLALAYRGGQTLFPVRKPSRRGVLEWKLPTLAGLHNLVSHPIYAGVYTHGRTETFVDFRKGKLVQRVRRLISPDAWKVCIKDHHEAYISWERYLENLAKLAEARPRWAMDDNRGAVREGRALLAGLVRCGQCGRKLRVSYNRKSSAVYYCDGAGPRNERRCVSFGAKYVDERVGEQLCRSVEPLAIEAAERAYALDEQQREGAVAQARLRVQAAQYAADRAFEQYDLADPKNRLVVDNLERRLNDKLAEVRAAREDLEQRGRQDPPLTEEQREEIHRLSRDFPGVWSDPDTPTSLRKQLLRVAIREIVVRLDADDRQLEIAIHWAGDTCTQVVVTKRATPVGSKADSSLTELVGALAQTLADDEIARILNMKKIQTPRGQRWSQDRVKAFRSHHRIRQGKAADDPDVLTGQQARDYLGIGYNGLVALVRRGAVHTNQATDFAPWRIQRAELDSDRVQALVRALKSTGRLPPSGGSPQAQGRLFQIESTPS
jgi:DNA invertase Pin-like site-specific DNA recombinase